LGNMRKLDKNSFIAQINALKNAASVQGKIYHTIRVDGNSVRFIRQGKSTAERIDLEELFELYQAIDYPTNKEARLYISGRVQSPAVSIINALGKDRSAIIPKAQQKVAPVVKVTRASTEKRAPSINKDKDETRFFQAFAEAIGIEYLVSKSVGKPIGAEDAFLTDDFRKYGFPDEVEKNFETFLEELNSNFNFSGKSLAHHIDGLLVNHPQLGTRIVEFDEEQHFTPSLFTVIKQQSRSVELAFADYYYSVLADIDYLNAEVLKKNRVKHRFDVYPANHNSFIAAIESEKVSGYIKPKENGFNYVGGRLAQRAYYDSLRNAAHLSPKNQGFGPVLRFPKKCFEDKAGVNFSRLGLDQIEDYIRECLLELYGFGN